MTSNLIRRAEVKDIPRIAEIIVFGKRVAYRKIFNNDMVSFNQLQVMGLAEKYYRDNKLLESMLVYDDGIVKGIINGRKRKDGIEICDFYVEPFFRGCGIGTQLLEQVVLDAVWKKEKRVYLWVIEENAEARRFYEKNGFSAAGKTNIIEGTDKLDVYYEIALCEDRKGP